MKKLVLTSICTLAVAGAAMAQGDINWTGPSAAAYTTQTNSTQYSPLFENGSTVTTGSGTVGNTSGASNSYYFELLYTGVNGSQVAQPTTLAQLATWSDAGLGGTNGTTAGRNAVFGNQSTASTAVPWAANVNASIMLVEWSANLGSTWSGALAELQADSGWTGDAFVGLSHVGYLFPIAANPGTVVFGNTTVAQGTPIGNSTLTQMYLVPVVPVPEPGTIAMAAIGGLSLLAFRRKK